MLLSLAATKAGAALLIMLGSLSAWAETSYHETLLKDKISTITILIAETVVFFALIVSWALFSDSRRAKLVTDFKRLSVPRWLFFVMFACFGLVGAYAGDAALVSHGTHNVRLSYIVIGLGVSSGLYMYSIDRKRTLKSLPWLIGLVVCAIGLATSKD